MLLTIRKWMDGACITMDRFCLSMPGRSENPIWETRVCAYSAPPPPPHPPGWENWPDSYTLFLFSAQRGLNCVCCLKGGPVRIRCRMALSSLHAFTLIIYISLLPFRSDNQCTSVLGRFNAFFGSRLYTFPSPPIQQLPHALEAAESRTSPLRRTGLCLMAREDFFPRKTSPAERPTVLTWILPPPTSQRQLPL